MMKLIKIPSSLRAVRTANREMTAAATVAEEEPLSPTSRLFHEPNFNCHIIVMMGLAKRIDIGVFKAGLKATLIRQPRFSSIKVLDEAAGDKKPKWVRTKVVLDDHLMITDLNRENSGLSPDQLVENYVASLSTSKLDPTRPLWDLHILNFRTAAAEATAVLRTHHSLGDGTSLMSLLLACTRKVSDPDLLPSLPDILQRVPPKRHAGVLGIMMSVCAVLAVAWRTLVELLLFVATAAFLRDTNTPLKGGEGVEFSRKRFVHRTVSLDDVKAVKNAMRCTINNVLVGITSAGLSRYLNRSYRDCDENKGKQKMGLPVNIRLRTTMLVNLRPALGIQALAKMMEGDGGCARWGNCMAYVILPFPIVMYEDPLDYIRKGKEIAERKKNSLEAILTYTCANLILKIFGVKATAALSHRVLAHTTLSFSNLVGPVEEVEFFGHPIVYIAPSVYGHPHALTVHFQSYMNKLTIVLAADEEAIPDPYQLLEDLAISLKLIKDAVVTTS